MKVKTITFILLALLLALAVTPVYADSAPALPHAFYGKVDVNGSPAPAGTEVEVRGEGVKTDIDKNPIVTTVEGEYGGSGPFAPKLVVQGDIAEGAAVTFYVNGVSTGQTTAWHSGEVTEIDLAATISGSSQDTTGDSTPDTADESPPPDTTDESPPDTTDSTPPDTGDSISPESTEPASDEASSAPLLPPSPPSAGSGGVPVLWLVIGGVVLVGLIIIFVVARRRAY